MKPQVEQEIRTPRRIRTEKGGGQWSTAASPYLDASGALDFFSKAPSMRGRYEAARTLFVNALDSHPHLAVRALFYLRYFRYEAWRMVRFGCQRYGCENWQGRHILEALKLDGG